MGDFFSLDLFPPIPGLDALENRQVAAQVGAELLENMQESARLDSGGDGREPRAGPVFEEAQEGMFWDALGSLHGGYFLKVGYIVVFFAWNIAALLRLSCSFYSLQIFPRFVLWVCCCLWLCFFGSSFVLCWFFFFRGGGAAFGSSFVLCWFFFFRGGGAACFRRAQRTRPRCMHRFGAPLLRHDFGGPTRGG